MCKRFGNIALNFTLAPSKIIFKLQSDGESEDTFTLSELGKASIMLPEYITGYKLENGVFTVNNDTKGNITVAGRTALIIPQTKENDLAVITLNGNKYRVSKEDGLEFLAGKIYTITVNMLKSGVTPTFSVTYTDWVNGGEYETGATPVSLSAEVGKSDVFEDGDKISLFHGQTKLTTYTYNKGGNDWTPDAPLYWEEIGDGSSENVNLRAEFIRNSSLHDSQLPELFLAETVCKRFGSVALNFTLAPSKIVFKLKSEGNPEEVFTQAELNKASILLPDYITGYKLENGIFTVTGGKSDVTVVNRTALIIPQTKKNDLAVITFNGNKYRVSEENGLEFLAGKVYTITVNILKSGATPTFSVTFTDWVPGGEIEIGATPVTIAPTPGKNGAFEDGDQVTLFHEQTKLAIYTYNKGADSWTPDAPLYWEEVGDGSSEEVNLRAEYIRDPALNESQLPEIFTGATTCKRFGSVALNLALEPSKIVFKLKSEGKAEEVFSQAELNKATILLPDYITGYTLENGVFTVTGSKSSVAVEDRTALIIPQTKKNDLAVITLNGNKYHVSAEDVQEFLAGKVYTITVNILKSDATPTFSVTFTDWVPGGEIEIGATPVTIAPNPGKNGAFEDGDQVTLFHEQTKLAVYTYNKGTDSWTPDAPLYWEEVGDGKSENVTLKAEFIRNQALNDSQLPEIFTGETTCKRFGSVALNLALEPSKIVFKLKSEGKAEEVFSQAELSKASIMLPGYITGYTLENGVFTITASKGDVTVAGRTAVVVPQTKKNDLAVITLGGNKYFVSKEEGQEFQAGKVYTIIVNILKSGVAPTFSVSFTDWVAGGEIEIGSTPVVISPNPGKNGAFEEGDRVTLFHEQTKLVTYTYNKATDDWTPNAPLYWEEIGDGKSENVTLKAEFIRNPALNNTQLPEIFTGETTCKRFGSVALNLALEPSKIVFKLKSEGKPEEVFSQAELSNASIMLPDYITGYTLENGVFTVTTTKGDVTVANRTAVIVPQTKKNDLAVITLNGNRYRVSKEEGQEFQAGKVYTIIVNLLKSGVAPTFSVSFTDWVPGGEIEIGATPVQISPTPGQNGDFRDGDEIVLYHEQTELVTYTYNKSKDEWTPNAPLYWEEIGDGNSAKVKLTGMYKRTDALNATQLPEVMLMETEVDRFQASLHLHFNLVPAKIVFELQSDGTFTEDELKNNTRIQLRNYIIGHTLQYGKFTVNATSKGNVDVEGFTALIVPQEKKGELALISLNGNAYEILDATGMNFEAGKAYKIKVKMSKTNVAFISMSYTDWQDGGEIVVGATPVNLVIPNTQTTDFKDKDKVTLYYGDEKLTTYTYDEPTGKWNPEQPIFWENIGDGVSEDVALRAEFIRASAPDNTQLPEIFLAETTSKRFQGIHLDFNLAPAKIRFVLKSESTDDAQKYAIDQLNGATITLPGYITGYTLANAVFTKGTQTGNINVVNKAAVIVPQEKDGVLALITIAGNTYQVKVNDPVNFQAGKVTTIEVNMLKAGMAGISASYTEWVPGDTEEFTTFIPTTAGTTTNFVPGDELSMYYDDKNGGKTKIGDFTYQGDHKWETNPAVYWENLDGLNSYKFYGVSTLSQAPAASNQMDDVMYAEHANVPRFGNIDLRFTKRTSRIVVGLKCSDGTFSKEELESAVITLPGYTIGGAYNGINYVAGTNKGSITASPTTTELAWVALIEPQTINAGEILINIRINGNDYLVKKTVNTEFEIARTYTYTVNLLKAGIDFSTSYADWAPGLEETIDVSLD
ncbi:fimbrillin family protein [Bacteroides sp. OttesenSCG-928-E20]|nr:fimbrillin family protein [Bacteroides sp. OttesenSCG-928-E20]